MWRLSATELTRSFKEGKITASEICKTFLKRIEKHDPSIGAFLSVFSEKSMKRAALLDEKRKNNQPLGRLAGVPVAIKDNMNVKGEITSCGSNFLTNFISPVDATVVRLLEEEDAIIIGKTNLDEFAMGSSTENSALQKTYNPWNLKCSPGGSSGGSAAAVAARLVPLALGSDTGGSVRQPASLCGVLGIKPTYGRVSRYGLVAFGSSLDQIGTFAHNIEDVSLMMEILGRHCEKDSTSSTQAPDQILPLLDKPIKGMKIGIPWQFLSGLEEETSKAFSQAIEVYKDLGCEIVDVDLSILKYSIATYYILCTAEASTNLSRFDGIRYGKRSKRAKTLDEVYDFSRQEGFGAEVKRRIMLGTFVLSSGYQDAYYRKAQKARTLILQKFLELFEKVDIIAMPTSPAPTFEMGSIQDPIKMYLLDIYSIAANLTGLPAISIPAGFSSDKKPIGLQLMAPQMKDALLCKAASAFEKKTSFNTMIPTQFGE